VTGTIDTGQLDQAGTLTIRDHRRSSQVVRITGVSTDAIASMLISSVAGRQTVMVRGPCPNVG
jgi:hypothetical protein